MEKDKLMELINNIVDERENAINEKKLQMENNTFKGLQLIKKCLEYANEKKCYFDKIQCGVKQVYICNTGKIINPIKWLYGNHKKFCFTYDCFNAYYIYLEDLKNFDFYLQNLYCNTSILARALLKNNYTFEKFKIELSEILANEIINYQKKTKEMKNKE